MANNKTALLPALSLYITPSSVTSADFVHIEDTGIAVATGDGVRVCHGLKMLEAGQGHRLLISSINTTLGVLFEKCGIKRDLRAH